MACEGQYQCCNISLETKLHVVRDCKFPWVVWSSIVPTQKQDVVDTSISWMRSYYPTLKAMLHSSSIAIDPKWSAPKSGWVKINIDGTVSLSCYSSTIGGVIRDTDGNWLCGYSMSLGKDEVFRIEARFMLEGLQVAWDKSDRQFELESDNVLLVELIIVNNSIDNLIIELRAIHKLTQMN
ncbi:uncharacterized protein LOC108458715 [Gossypium arboreum]|uniref:RNase H type-1 domain-containing protein n=1 Tax=Gossypium arboreum TaxID=29729 RepID=A0ABR0P3S5_GOSAR|nr:uncharacterized protein LOC108458715 [Gossypium arboreum]KAK5812352.1 hypothetical protein PVK06_027781 [Gossypium arboreum]